MCEQCLAKTVIYVGSNSKDGFVLPGYYLVRATQDGNWMQKDDWGLVRCNDPDYVWEITPVIDPFYGLKDEEIDAKNVNKKEVDDFDNAVSHLEDSLDMGQFEHAYLLGVAMREAGYNPTFHGYRSAEWLCHYLAEFIKTAKISNIN